jgi:hypothetical protein
MLWNFFTFDSEMRGTMSFQIVGNLKGLSFIKLHFLPYAKSDFGVRNGDDIGNDDDSDDDNDGDELPSPDC